MSWKLSMLTDLAKEIFSAVHPLLGTAKSREVLGLGFGGDKTRFIDAASETAALQYLEKKGFSCIFIGEECGVKEIGLSPKFYLILDGVDGTTNAMRGIGFASASIAMSPTSWLRDVEAAVVIDLYNGGIYSAEKGGGAKFNSQPITTSSIKTLEEAVLSIDVSRSPVSIEKVAPLVSRVRGVRALGSASLEICHVASGLLDAYVDIRGKLRIVDFAAGMLIVREAGGVFLQPNGEDMPDSQLTELRGFSVVASANRDIFDKICLLISPNAPR
ncbi:D-fructose 1,6-bisphosphatase [Candidatus Bathyarchaeota archaeon]|nr:D-fructose 1,6-bisphosphatase [Candidatus Bathyarchaeota archaeon]